MRIAVFGARGVPAKWGGFDTFVTELTPRLAKAGHDVTLFTMPKYTGDDVGEDWRGVRIVRLPTVYGKFTETLLHELFSSLYALVRPKQDVYYILGCRTIWAYLPHKLLGRRLVIHTDGLDWKRRKWGRFARAYLKANYWLARKITDRLVSDSKQLQQFYQEEYGADSAFLTYGAKVAHVQDESQHRQTLSIYDAEPGGYYLVVARMEPENNVDVIVREYERTNLKEPLLVVGGANYRSSYLEHIQQTTDPRIRFLGPVYEPGHLEALHLGAKAYLHGHEVGGTNPSLLGAMGCGNLVLAHDVRFNREVLGGSGLLWSKDEGSLAAQLEHVDREGDALRAEAEVACRERIARYYTWDKAAADQERYFRYVAGEVSGFSESF